MAGIIGIDVHVLIWALVQTCHIISIRRKTLRTQYRTSSRYRLSILTQITTNFTIITQNIQIIAIGTQRSFNTLIPTLLSIEYIPIDTSLARM